MGASTGGADREFAFNEALGGKDSDLCDDLARISTMSPHSLEVVDANTLYSSLKAIGLSKSQLRALLPDWWDDKAAATSAGAWELEAKVRARWHGLPCRVFRLGGQKSPWLVSVSDLAVVLDTQREEAGPLQGFFFSQPCVNEVVVDSW
jgi:hypothetical protein